MSTIRFKVKDIEIQKAIRSDRLMIRDTVHNNNIIFVEIADLDNFISSLKAAATARAF